jgi:hypothetical protein
MRRRGFARDAGEAAELATSVVEKGKPFIVLVEKLRRHAALVWPECSQRVRSALA